MKLIFVILSVIVTMILSTSIELSLLLQLGLFITFLYFFKLIDGLGSTLPIKEMMSFLLFIQFFVSPLITYRYFDNDAIFSMYVPEEVYFGFVVPALISFIIGLNLPLRNDKKVYNNAISLIMIRQAISNSRFSINLIIIGFISLAAREYLAISSLYFVFYLASLLRFVGAFMLYFSSHPYRIIIISLVFIQFIYEIVNGGVFYDLFVWLFFLYMLIEFNWRSSFLRKLLFVCVGILTVFFIQSIKKEYREAVWNKESVDIERTEVFVDIATERINQSDLFKEESNLDRFVSRLNTGWIVSKVLEHTPRYEPFVNGKLVLQDLKNLFLPRFLFPDKVSSGGEDNQRKFTRFTGRVLIGGTTMRIGSISDAYVNFGIVGGWICLFVLGFIFNIVLYFILSLSKTNPQYILWIPFVFAYAVRMSDINVILNYTFKTLIIMVFVNIVFLNRKMEVKSA